MFYIQPPRWGRVARGEIIGELNDMFGHFVRVRLEGSTLDPLFRSSELESECLEGGRHTWEDGMCTKCWEDRK